MKKVYLLTFHGSVNYGAVLQAYALSATIKKLGYQCEVIDYNRGTHHSNFTSLHYNGNIKSLLYQFIGLPRKKVLDKKFNRFTTRRMNLTERAYNGYQSINDSSFPDDAVYIVGSDQVWNIALTENDFHYYLDFTNSAHKYSYAASFGVSDIAAWDNIPECKSYLSKFKRISVREESGKEIVQQLAGQAAEVVCDPTFLLSPAEWKSISVCHRTDKYVLVFMLSPDNKLIEAAQKASKEKGIPMINLVYTGGKIAGAQNVYTASPEEWLGYIGNADCVFTNSFHGFALSLNLQRNVWFSLDKGKRGTRLICMAERYGVSNQNISCFDVNQCIDYDVVLPLMEKDKEKSISYLRGILNES